MPDLSYTSIADKEAFEERLRALPTSPGVYIFKDAGSKIIYVGKSKSLRDRVRSYFGSPRGLSSKTRRLVQQIADMEIRLTDTELEALLLEMNLIKRHRPKYNILLKDDKTYPYIKITNEEWPRVLKVRKVLDDGARYYGPFASAGSIDRTIELLNKIFAFRLCADDYLMQRRRMGRPCLYYDIKRCLGPCVPGLTNNEEYMAAIQQVRRFLDGRSEQILSDLRQKMEQAAENLEFERAAYYRDQIRDVERVLERQKVITTAATDQDVIALAREDERAVVQVFYIRGGKLIGSEPFPLEGGTDEDQQTILASFLTQFYDSAASIPPSILLAEHPEEAQIIEQWLEKKGGHKVTIQVPRRGQKRELVDLAARNAAQALEDLRLQWLNSEQRATAGLQELRELLELPRLPMRVECYDISNIQGTHATGSMVVFEAGEPKKAHYRRFKIRDVEGQNDVASLQEVVRRRFLRADPEQTQPADEQPSAKPAQPDESWITLPDLILVDGGIGQANAVRAVLDELGYQEIPVAGLVKGDTKGHLPSAIVMPGWSASLALPVGSQALHLVQRIDEEAHRFAITYHRKLRSKGMTTSILDEIPGIGPRRRRELMRRFGSLDAIRSASIDELAAVPGMTRRAAEELKAAL